MCERNQKARKIAGFFDAASRLNDKRPGEGGTRTLVNGIIPFVNSVSRRARNLNNRV